MSNQNVIARRPLPHHRLVAYQVACELLVVVKEAHIKDTKLRDQAERAAKSCCLNIAEAAGRVGGADKKRVFAIARGEAVEVVAAVEIAALAGDASDEAAAESVRLGDRLVALLSGLAR